MPKSLFAVFVVLVCIASASGPASSQAPGPRPELSGTLNLLCTPQIVWCEGMKAEFQKVYPKVTVEFVRLSSGEALTRLRNEAKTRTTPIIISTILPEEQLAAALGASGFLRKPIAREELLRMLEKVAQPS